MGDYSPKLIRLQQAILNTSVTAASNFFASNIPMSTFMTVGEDAVLWVQFCSATNSTLEVIYDSGSASVIMSASVEGTGSTASGTGVLYNYKIPVMGDDAINFSPTVSGTTAWFFACIMA